MRSPGVGTGALAPAGFSSARNPSPRGPGVLFCLVFSTSHQSDDSTQVASGMEMFKLLRKNKAKVRWLLVVTGDETRESKRVALFLVSSFSPAMFCSLCPIVFFLKKKQKQKNKHKKN